MDKSDAQILQHTKNNFL